MEAIECVLTYLSRSKTEGNNTGTPLQKTYYVVELWPHTTGQLLLVFFMLLSFYYNSKID